jgi:WD40 repeat protein
VEKLARATHAAHLAGIIHRDLKPANVLLASGEASPGVATPGLGTPRPSPLTTHQPKVTDFGLAKRLDVAGQTVSGAIVGTPSYMAPEQASSKGKEIGPATDVYGLGAILYELLTGRPPFKGTTPLETVLQVISDEPVSPRQLQPKTPRDLEIICLKCLQKDARKRYATAKDLAADLRRFQIGEPIVNRAAGGGERTIKWIRRRPALAALLALVVLGTVAGFALVLWRLHVEGRLHSDAEAARSQAVEAGHREQRQRREAERSLYFLHLAQAHREWSNQNVDQARHVLALCPKEPRGWEWYCLQRWCSSIRPVTLNNEELVNSVCFSPDGKRLACGCRDNTVKLWDVSRSAKGRHPGGQQVLALTGHTAPVTGVAFSPDGRRIASGSEDRTVRVWDAGSGQQVLALRGHTGGVTGVAFSPDGKTLATGSKDGTARLWDPGSGRPLGEPLRDAGYVEAVAFSPDGKRIAGGFLDKTVKVWDAESGEEVLALRGHTQGVHSVAFSPDGKHIASGSEGMGAFAEEPGEVKVWDAQTGREVLALAGHTAGAAVSVAFSPDGTRLASGAGAHLTPGEVKLWYLSMSTEGGQAGGQELLTLQGHTREMTGVAFSPDGRLACAFGDEVTVYDGSPLEKPAVAAPLP